MHRTLSLQVWQRDSTLLLNYIYQYFHLNMDPQRLLNMFQQRIVIIPYHASQPVIMECFLSGWYVDLATSVEVLPKKRILPPRMRRNARHLPSFWRIRKIREGNSMQTKCDI